MIFYRCFYLRIYLFFKRFNARNFQDSAIGIVSAITTLVFFKIHSLISRFIFNVSFKYEDVAIPYFVAFVVVFFTNKFFLLESKKVDDAMKILKASEKSWTSYPCFFITIVLLVVLFLL
jgi:hypothetical protein